MAKKVKYALIGFGGIAENRVAKEGFACDKSRFKPLKYAQLVGATDMNPARKSAAEALGLKWYDNMDAILADPAIDAVYIATNNKSHAPLCLAALKAGKHVIVEKPAATSIKDAQAMIAAAKKRGLSLSVDHMMVNNAWTVCVESDVVYAPRTEHGDDATEHRLAPHRHKRLRRRARERPKPSSVARRQDNRLANFHGKPPPIKPSPILTLKSRM